MLSVLREVPLELKPIAAWQKMVQGHLKSFMPNLENRNVVCLLNQS